MATRPLACRELVELVTDYLEGALAADVHRAVADHLRRCEGCRLRQPASFHGGRPGLDGTSLTGSPGVQQADGGVSRLARRPRCRRERHVTRRPPQQTAPI